MNSQAIKMLLIYIVVCAISVQSSNSAVFIVNNTNDIGAGSLRAAMQSANATQGHDTIVFNIFSSPSTTITIYPLSALPLLTDPMGVTIDGFSQGSSSAGSAPPATANLMIAVNGAKAGNVHGFHIVSSNNIIQGLIVDSFAQDGIRIEGTVAPGTFNNLVYCCFVGADHSGSLDYGNGWNIAGGLWAGINILVGPCSVPFYCYNNMVDGCLSSGNFAEGVSITNCPPGDCYQNTVQNSYIGVDITGLFDLGNDHDGVLIGEGARDNIVINNIISGNDYEGVTVIGLTMSTLQIYSYGNTIQSNMIGVGSDGITTVGNTRDGISFGIYGPPSTWSHMGHAIDNVVIYNTIANNGGNGVVVYEHFIDNFNGDRNEITENSIYRNGLLGIDLDNDGITYNDPYDVDLGANEDMNFPVLLNAYECNGQVIVNGNIDVAVNPTLVSVEIYLAATDDTLAHGEGITYLAKTSPDALGLFSVLIPVAQLHDTLTAIAIDTSGNTSEFALNIVVDSGMVITEIHNDVSCNGMHDGFVDITVRNGAFPVSYLWSNGFTSEDIISVGAGTYKLTVTNPDGCYDSITVVVTEPDSISVSAVLVHPSSWGANDGMIDITVTGGNGAFSYLWSNSVTSEDISGVGAGVYCVTITDVAGCQKVWCDTLKDPSGLAEEISVSITISPNPAGDLLFIDWGETLRNTTIVSVFDIRGVEIVRENINVGAGVSKLDISSLESGIYIVVLKHLDFFGTTKLVKK